MNCSVVTRMRSLLPYAVHCIMTTTFSRGISMMLTTILWPGETILIVICFMTVSVTTFRSSHRRCSVRNCVLRNFVKFTGKRLCQSLSFNKLQASLRLAILLKKDSGTGIFQWILRNFKQHLFYRTSPGDCLTAQCQNWSCFW